MNPFLLKICTVENSCSLLINEYRNLKQAHNRALVARAVAATARLRRPKAERASTTPLQKKRRHGRCHSLQRILQRHLDMASHQEIRRRSSAADRAPVTPIVAAAATASTFSSVNNVSIDDDQPHDAATSDQENDTGSAAMPPPPPPSGESGLARSRSLRATSFASRNANRLSLTLPIAPPSSDPSRPTPTLSSTPSTIPPTPNSTPAAPTTPANANDFIIAIAAQERRVLELKEELARAETDLVTLKKQWSLQEASSRKTDSRRTEYARPTSAASHVDDESNNPRSSMDADVRKSKFLQNNQNTPGSNRRRVLRGGHARTLSLLSPLKPESAGFAVHEDRDGETFRQPFRFPPPERAATQPLAQPQLPKRASWQPQSQLPQTNVPGLVEDFRLGLKAFVEDIRQITVGDEPITGQPSRSHTRASPVDQDTIRASHASRPRINTAFDSPTPGARAPSSASTRSKEATPEKGLGRRSKHFSWTPLSFDSLDDNGWTSWESPASVKSTRWSGSTINSGAGQSEETDSLPEVDEDSSTDVKSKESGTETPALAPPKLGEILPNVVTRLSPSNIKRTANNLMDEWERSLTDPVADQENTAS